MGQRLRAVQFQRQFDGRHEALHAQIQTLEDASAETRSNRLLPCVLKTCLDVGNYLNAGHRAGAAAGFQIESLLKLKAVRSSKHPGRTLLHFVARQVLSRVVQMSTPAHAPVECMHTVGLRSVCSGHATELLPI